MATDKLSTGDETGAAGETAKGVPRHVDGIAADVAATMTHLRSRAGGGAAAVYSVGFCFGGRNSFNQATRDHGLAGVIEQRDPFQDTVTETSCQPVAPLGMGETRCTVCV